MSKCAVGGKFVPELTLRFAGVEPDHARTEAFIAKEASPYVRARISTRQTVGLESPTYVALPD
jgi:hypothetical protein